MFRHILLKIHDILPENLLVVRVLLHLLGLSRIIWLTLEYLHHLSSLLEVGDLFLNLRLNLSGQLLECLLLLLRSLGISSSLLLVYLLIKINDPLTLGSIKLLLWNLGSLFIDLSSHHLLLKHLIEQILDLGIFNKALQELDFSVAECLNIQFN